MAVPPPDSAANPSRPHPIHRRIIRIIGGTALLLGGTLGFLPILGFWMIPLGISLLGQEIPAVRQFELRVGRWLRSVIAGWRVRRGK